MRLWKRQAVFDISMLATIAILFILACFFMVKPLFAQVVAPPTMGTDSFNVATGNNKAGTRGAYSTMFNEMAKECGTTINLVEVPTTGSIENLNKLIENTVDAAIVQGDVAEYERTVNPDRVAGLRTLFTLHPEELHFIARADVKTEGGFSIGGHQIAGGKEVSFTKLEDLRGRVIGAAGGSVKTGNMFSRLSNLGFQVRDLGDNATLKAELLAGRVDVILVVAGAPSEFVKGLDKNFRLLPVTAEMAASMARVRPLYKPATLTYDNLGQSGVPTVSTQALFMTRTYKSPAMIAKLVALRNCFVSRVPTLQDRRGTHAKWQLVDPADHGTWQWYDLPKQ